MSLPPDFNYYTPAYGATPPQHLAPARRAATLMLVLGILMASFGLCNAINAVRLSPEEMIEQQSKLMPPNQASPIAPALLRRITMGIAVLVVVVGLLLVGLSIAVRGGSYGGAMAGLVVAIVIDVVLLVFVVFSLIASLMTPMFLAFVCMFAVPLALFSLLFLWLIQALRATPTSRGMRTFYAQYGQYYPQQNQPGPYSPPYAPPMPPPPNYPQQPPGPPSP